MAVLAGDDVEYADETYFPSGLGRSCLTDEQWASVAYFLAAGVSVMEVARHYGVSRTTIWRGMQRSAGLRHRIRAERNMRRRESDGRFVALRNAVVDGLQQAILDRNIRVLLWAAERLDLGGSILPKEDEDPMGRSAKARRTPRAVRAMADAALERVATAPAVTASQAGTAMPVTGPAMPAPVPMDTPAAGPAAAPAPLMPPPVDPPVIVIPSDAPDLHRELAGDRPLDVPEWQTWGPWRGVTTHLYEKECAQEQAAAEARANARAEAVIDAEEDDLEEDDLQDEDLEEDDAEGPEEEAAEEAEDLSPPPPDEPVPVPSAVPPAHTPAALSSPADPACDPAPDLSPDPVTAAPRIIPLLPRRVWPALRRLAIACSRHLPMADDVDGMVIDQLWDLSRHTLMPRPFCDAAQPLDPYRPLVGYRWR